jgi:hypothetical protein
MAALLGLGDPAHGPVVAPDARLISVTDITRSGSGARRGADEAKIARRDLA